jgi:hypothetical protein
VLGGLAGAVTQRHAERAIRGKFAASPETQNPMATLPGLPQTDEPEPDALPVEPDDGTSLPGPLPEDPPGHEPIDPPKA